MESNMVNSDLTWSNSNNNLVKKFFIDNLPDFHVVSETSHGAYWGVDMSNEEIIVKISGDIGFNIEVFINSAKFPLWQYDRDVNNAMETNAKNILYQLGVLKKFLSHNS